MLSTNILLPKERIDSLTSLRGIAAWWVVFYHFREAMVLNGTDYSFLAAGGYIAVDIFFVLSGFVIYLNSFELFKKISFKSTKAFFIRRLARVYPLHLTILIFYLVNPLLIYLYSSSGNTWSRYSVEYYFASILMIQNWGFFDYIAWNIPAWSISTEFAAYLLFPFICLFANKVRWIGASLSLAFALVAIIYIFKLNDFNSIGENITHFGIIRCFLEFSCGVFLAKIRITKTINTQKIQIYFFIFFVIFVLCLYNKLTDYYYIPFFSVAIIAFLSIKETWQSHLLENRFLVKIGEVSYSTYLVHYLIKDWVKFPSAQLGLFQLISYLILVLLFSFILHRFIEVPGKNFFLSKSHDR